MLKRGAPPLDLAKLGETEGSEKDAAYGWPRFGASLSVPTKEARVPGSAGGGCWFGESQRNPKTCWCWVPLLQLEPLCWWR